MANAILLTDLSCATADAAHTTDAKRHKVLFFIKFCFSVKLLCLFILGAFRTKTSYKNIYYNGESGEKVWGEEE